MTSFSFLEYFDAFELDVNVVNFVCYGKTRSCVSQTNGLSPSITDCHFYRPQMKFAKVMFLQVSVCPQWGGMCGCSQGGVCVVAPGGHAWLLWGGHAWLLWGGMHA